MFSLRADGTFKCDLDGTDIASYEEAEEVSGALLGLRDEVRAVLRARPGHSTAGAAGQEASVAMPTVKPRRPAERALSDSRSTSDSP